jgi:hypothetical protein
MSSLSKKGFPGDPLRGAALPLLFASLGVGYYCLTAAGGPKTAGSLSAADEKRFARHKRDALFAAGAGLGAAAVLWWMR